MRVSQRLDYTLRMLVALARLPEGTRAASGELARALGMPRRFGEQQMTALAKTGLVTCKRGAAGGCALGRPAADITALDVVRGIQGDALDVPRASASATSALWADVARTLDERLASTTLADLAREQADIDAAAETMYFI
ncbi:MAG: Rrf2 family transcriptional regulator [Coriobacteriia bacterium]|nr:Rrf2 family transcriptional regulator [Actinomycetota bacterium]MDZ4167406.1 Rrf2 family transcriptional regulator [Coriobacteriia bacterium]